MDHMFGHFQPYALNHPLCLVQWLDQTTHPNKKGPAGAAGFSACASLKVWSQTRLAQLAETSPRSSRYVYMYIYVYIYMGVSENSVPLNPMVNDHYPY